MSQIVNHFPKQPLLMLLLHGIFLLPLQNALQSGDAMYQLFPGHFPGYAVMPGVLIVEALAQVGVVATMSAPGHENMLVLFAGIDKVRFKKEVRPGDQLILKVELTRTRKTFGKAVAEATVDDELVASAELMFMLRPGPTTAP